MLCMIAGMVSAQSLPDSAALVSQDRKSTTAAPAKILLNTEDMGTSGDTSWLRKRLEEIFRRRIEQRAYKRGLERRSDLSEDQRIEKTVFVRAERASKIEELVKIVEAVMDAGAEPILLHLPTKAGDKVDWMGMKPGKPNPLVLLVRIQQLNSAPALDRLGLPAIDDLLISNSLPILLSSAAEGESLLVITIPRDGEYYLDEKRIEERMLETEIRARIKLRPANERVIYARTGPGTSFGSLEDLYHAAFAAGSKGVNLDAGAQIFKWPDHDMEFTLPAGWRKHRIDAEIFDLRGPDGARLSVDLLDRQGTELPDIRVGYEDLVQAQKKGTYEDVGILEVDGVKGLLSRWSRGEFDPNATHLRWQAFRMRKGKLQYIQINVGIPVDRFKARQKELTGILNSIKFPQR